MTTDISIVRWDPSQNNGQDYIDEYEYDGGNSSSRLFERSRIKALAGKTNLQADCVKVSILIYHLLWLFRGKRDSTKENFHEVGELSSSTCKLSHQRPIRGHARWKKSYQAARNFIRRAIAKTDQRQNENSLLGEC